MNYLAVKSAPTEPRRVNRHRYGPRHILKTQLDHCRFLEGDDHICCGQQTLPGKSYCLSHFMLCTTGRR